LISWRSLSSGTLRCIISQKNGITLLQKLTVA